jgi:hypothetical protein
MGFAKFPIGFFSGPWVLLALVSSTFERGAQLLRIPIGKRFLALISITVSHLTFPTIFLYLLNWYSNFYFRDHLFGTHAYHIFSITKSITKHIKDITLKGIFSSGRSSSLPQENYVYAVLPRESPSFRLLEYQGASIFPLHKNHNLEYKISIFPLTRAPEYTAISYTWGNANLNKCITIHDGTTQPVLAITTSAMECLLALKKRNRYIWIDSICINQSDPDEKTEQVRLMRDIYSTAAEVVAVLSDSVMATICPTLNDYVSEILHHSFEYHYSGAKSLLGNSMFRTDVWGDDEDEEIKQFLGMATGMYSPLICKVLWVLCHPYWTRVWIIQELAVANHVFVYSDQSFREISSWFELAQTYRNKESTLAGPGIDFSDAVKMYHSFSSKLRRTFNVSIQTIEEELLRSYTQGVERLLSIRDIRQRYHGSKRIDIQDAMLLSMNSLATDPRDKVFGVKGMLLANKPVADDNWFELKEQSIVNASIVANYKLSTREVFVNVSTIIATSGDSRLIFFLAGIGWPRGEPNLPSWTIDWTSLPPLYPAGRASLETLSRYRAHRARSEELATSRKFISLDRAAIEGTFNFIDKIEFISERIESQGHSWFPEVWNAICSLDGESYSWSTWPCPREEAVWRTLFAQRGTLKPRDRCYDDECHVDERLISKFVDMYDDIRTLRSQNMDHTCRETVNKAFLAWSPAHKLNLDEKEISVLSNSFSEALSLTKAIGCRFAITREGYIGTVPPMSLVGDEISINPICPVPIVLRRFGYQYNKLGSGRKDSTFQLVGSCHVLGLMDGEPGCDGPANRRFYNFKGNSFTDRAIVLI